MLTSGEIINDMAEYSIVRLNRSNLKDLAKLHSEVYTSVDENHYLKKYDTAYTQVQFTGFIAYSIDDAPVAYYGVIPCFIQFENEKILAAQSADTMTHPTYRNKGLFVKLATHTFQLCIQLGIRLIFGFPNQHSYPGFIKLGWEMTETMDCFTIPVQTLPLAALSSKTKFLRNIYDRYCNFILRTISTSLKGVSSSVLAGGLGGVYRNADYLNYKTYSATRVIAIGSSKIWISYKHDLRIGDIENVNEKFFLKTMGELKKIAKKLGQNQIQFHTSTGTTLHHMFAQHYFASASFPVLFKDLGSGIPFEKIKFTFADIDIF